MRWPTIFSERRGPLTVILLLTLAAGSWWLAQDQVPDKDPVEQADTGDRPDYYVKGLVLTTTDPDGNPSRSLSAAELRHYLQDESTEVESAALTLYTDDGNPWRVAAASGWVSADGEEVLLKGPVTLDREGGPDNRPLKLETRDLRIQPREGYAETDEKVTVVSDQDRVEAVGFQAWLKRPTRIKFLAQVKGRYVPR